MLALTWRIPVPASDGSEGIEPSICVRVDVSSQSREKAEKFKDEELEETEAPFRDDWKNDISGSDSGNEQTFAECCVVDMFYALHFRERILPLVKDGVDTLTKSETDEVARKIDQLESYCLRLDEYVVNARVVAASYVSFWNRAEMRALSEKDASRRELFKELLQRLGDCTRGRARIAVAQELLSLFSDVDTSPDHILTREMRRIIEFVRKDDVNRARRLYRKLPEYFEEPYRLAYTRLMHGYGYVSKPRIRMEERFEHLFLIMEDSERVHELCESQPETLVLELEAGFSDAVAVDPTLSLSVVEEKCQLLYDLCGGKETRLKDYFNDDGLPDALQSPGKRAKRCFGILVTEGTKDVAAFSGCYDEEEKDGEKPIMEFFAIEEWTEEKGRGEKRNILEDIAQQEAFQNRFDLARIHDNNLFVVAVDGILKPIRLGEMRDIVKGVGKGSDALLRRMYSCVERKLIAHVIHSRAMGLMGCPSGFLITGKDRCKLCDTAIDYYRSKGIFDAKSPYLTYNVHNDVQKFSRLNHFAVRILQQPSDAGKIAFKKR